MRIYTRFILLAILLLVVLGVYSFLSRPRPAPVNPLRVQAPVSAVPITVSSPVSGAAVSSPLVVSGQARGTWYFEASFPLTLEDSSGKVIAQGPAKAQGNWMTDALVPFTATLTFAKPASGSAGTLVLKNDNPSGNPANDQSVEIPVTFK